MADADERIRVFTLQGEDTAGPREGGSSTWENQVGGVFQEGLLQSECS